jgi:hypothetical protein
MRPLLLICVFIAFSSKLCAQSPKQITTWLYDLPIQKNSKKLRKTLQADSRFLQIIPLYKNKYSTRSYSGKILNPNFPYTDPIDSSRIQLFFGNVHGKDEYSGDIKILKFEYFSKDTLFIHEIFNMAKKDLMEDAIKQSPTGFRMLNNESVGKGTEFIYVSSSQKLMKISAEKVKYSDGRNSFIILFVGSNN